MLIGFQDDTRDKIPDFDSLYYIYSILLIPTLFSLLVGLNILGWSKARINYVFIFGASRVQARVVYDLTPLAELDVKTKMDHREYFEVGLVPSVAHTQILIYEPRFLHSCCLRYVTLGGFRSLELAHHTLHRSIGLSYGYALLLSYCSTRYPYSTDRRGGG